MIAPAKLWTYEAVGISGTSPIIFLHGFMERGQDWMPIAHRLERDAYLILPDLPGHGQNTQRNIVRPLSFDKLGKELAYLLDHLGLMTVDLVGYSMGGRLALYFAIHYPNRVRTLVLESASAGIILAKDRKDRQIVDSAHAEQILEEGMQRFVDSWYKMPLFHSLAMQKERFENIKQARMNNDPGWMVKVVCDLSPGYQPHVWDQLRLLEMPVLLITGEMDNKYTSIMQEMGMSIKKSKEIIVSGSGHNCHVEQPERFLHYLMEFLGVETD